MMKQFKYELIVRGVLTYELPIAPIGWDKNLIKQTRNTKYYGLMRVFTAPLEFVKQGNTIICREWADYKSRADVEVRISELQVDWSYKVEFQGPLDFTTIKVKDHSVIINALSSGIESNVKAYEKANYQIPVTGSEVKNITIPSLRLLESASFIFNTDTEFEVDYFPGLTILTVEAASNVSSVQAVERVYREFPDWSTAGEWFFRCPYTGQVKIKGTLQAAFLMVGASSIDISIIKTGGTKVATIYSHSGALNSSFTFDIDVSFNLTVGERLYWYFGGASAVGGPGAAVIEGDFKIEYYTISAPTQCDVVPMWWLHERLMEKMNGVVTVCQSNLLRNAWGRLYVTCGDALRRLNTKTTTDMAGNTITIPSIPAIKTNWEDFFQTCNALLNCGWAVEGATSVLEGKSYFYRRSSKTLSVRNNKEVEFTQGNQYLFQTIKGGYEKQTYDELNGRDETNSEVFWTLPINKTSGEARELNLQAKYRADIYGIEIARLNLVGKNSVDSDSDNDTFLFYLNEALDAPEPAPPMFSGVTSGATIYNWIISPKRNLLRHGDYLHSILYGLDAYSIVWASSDKNADLVTIDSNGLSVIEKGDIKVNSLSDPLFIPIIANFKASYNDISTLGSNPWGYVEFVRKGRKYRGYIDDAGVDISKHSEQQYTLILTPDTPFK